MTVHNLISNFNYSDFHISIYINNILVMMGTPDEIHEISSSYILNSKVLEFHVDMVGELEVYIKI